MSGGRVSGSATDSNGSSGTVVAGVCVATGTMAQVRNETATKSKRFMAHIIGVLKVPGGFRHSAIRPIWKVMSSEEPVVSATVTRNKQGTEDVVITASGTDGLRL